MYIKHRACCRCGVVKPLNAENFPVRYKNQSMYRGICLKCWAKEHPEEVKQHFHRIKLWHMCEKKQAFKSLEAARNVAIKHALKHKGQVLQSYQCPACGKWHNTTHPR